MQQTLFGMNAANFVVNVASVPQRSLFRYPGGKTWLIPYIRYWLTPHLRQELKLVPINPTTLIEPFTGGGIVSLTSVAEDLVKHAIMAEKDPEVASVWLTTLNPENAAWLAQQIVSFEMTHENVVACLAKKPLDERENAFRTILRNRVNRGGILAPGAGLLKNGEDGKGLKSRWYPETLKKRIQHIVTLSHQLSFILGDGMKILQEHTNDADVVFFIDPPYTIAGKKAGKRLYTHSELDHEELFTHISTLQSDFLLTYDDTQEIRDLAKRFHFDVETVSMRNTHHTKMSELLIAPDLTWLRHLTKTR